MDSSEKKPKSFFSNTFSKDIRVQTKSSKNALRVETSDNDLGEQRTMESKINWLSSPTAFRVRKTINLMNTPKLSSMGIINQENKFERIFLSVEKHPSKIEEDEIDDQIPSNLNNSFELEIEDQKPKELVGVDAVRSYYSHYKRLDKIKDKNLISSTNASPYTAMLSKTESDFLLPTKLGLVKFTGDENRIKINNYKYGDKYACVMSEGIKLLPKISHFNLSDNRLTQHGAKILLSQLGKSTKVVDLARNLIGLAGCENIYNIIIMKDCRIEELNLEDNKLGDKAVKIICEGLLKNFSLKRLNLSKNYLTTNIGESIKSFLVKNPYLNELYLHWNQIKGVGAQKIFQGLLENETITVLDISWNSLGGNNPSLAPLIVEVLQKNEKIIHLDLSNNNFSLQESKLIASGLENNHSIYGFHFSGNYGYVDSKGFLIVHDFMAKDMSELHINNRISGSV